jgi:electron transfer flavoprotein beta subunit
VPDTTEIKIDPVTNTLIRAGVPSIVNPFDGYALELAVQLKEKHGGTVTTLCMGPEQAKDALRTCLSVGADKAFLVSDRVFGGSDTLATSYILSTALKYLEDKEGKFDIIFCGKQAIDGDTGQVGPEIAEHLNIAQLTYANNIEMTDPQTIKVTREVDSYKEVLSTKLPAVVTVIKTAWEPRYPSMKSKMTALRAEIPTITSAELSSIDTTKIGLKGSPTKVKKTFTPSLKKGGKKVEAVDAAECAKGAAAFLEEIKAI